MLVMPLIGSMQFATALFSCFVLSHASEPLRENLVGGQDVAKGDFPYMAALFKKDKNLGYSFVGSGSIIGCKWILTAARCTYDVEGMEPGMLRENYCDEIFVVVGEVHATSKSKMHTVRQCYRLPSYTNTFYYIKFDDIALLELEEPLVWTPSVSPIRLGPLRTKHQIKRLFAAGYGLESEDEKANPRSDNKTLTYITLNTVPFKTCNEYYRLKPRNYICARTRIYGGTCAGDAGGPLVAPKNVKQVGITSFSIECTGKTPSVFMRISHFLPWIEVVTGLKF